MFSKDQQLNQQLLIAFAFLQNLSLASSVEFTIKTNRERLRVNCLDKSAAWSYSRYLQQRLTGEMLAC